MNAKTNRVLPVIVEERNHVNTHGKSPPPPPGGATAAGFSLLRRSPRRLIGFTV